MCKARRSTLWRCRTTCVARMPYLGRPHQDLRELALPVCCSLLTLSRVDILIRAQEFGMKIWTVEKLQRILEALIPASHPNLQRQAPRGRDLSELLRNER